MMKNSQILQFSRTAEGGITIASQIDNLPGSSEQFQFLQAFILTHTRES